MRKPDWLKNRTPWVPDPAKIAALRTRLLHFVTWDGNSSCWLWTGYVCKFGYGRWWRGRGVSALAHRGAFEMFRGPVLPELELDHTCGVRMCVNPWHLEVVTNREHKRRTLQRLLLRGTKIRRRCVSLQKSLARVGVGA